MVNSGGKRGRKESDLGESVARSLARSADLQTARQRDEGRRKEGGGHRAIMLKGVINHGAIASAAAAAAAIMARGGREGGERREARGLPRMGLAGSHSKERRGARSLATDRTTEANSSGFAFFATTKGMRSAILG